ncbi:MAG: alpha-L-fucosidase [Chitinophagaceae bacterium]|nr:MAG: alpha-L-fucosidase [Chitinophagaceae bacterium]
MKKLISFTLMLLFVSGLFAQPYTPTAANLAARKNFQDMKFGMFIHWGASSVLGSGEWVMNNRNIRVNEYNTLQRVFNPIDFDAKAWVATAKNAGMQYITFITRHHDGFSNWDTKLSPWKITNTPYGKDALKQLAEECHKQGIKLFLYYSLLDWYRDDYQYETGKTGKGTGRTQKSNWASYISFMKGQLTELLTQYGEIAGIWFDGHWDQLDNDHDKTLQSKVNWHYDEIYTLIHQLQPQCLISNNHHLAPIPGEDFQAFEKDLPGKNTTGFGGAGISSLPLETCETMNDSWGYNMTDRKFKSVPALIRYMVNAAGQNANFLLNVGPKPNGQIQSEFTDTLAMMGRWMQQYGSTIYGSRGSVIPEQDWGTVTMKGNKLYVHILHPAKLGEYVFLPGVKNKISAAATFNNNTGLKFIQQAEGVFVYLTGVTFDSIDTILALTLQ